MLRTKDYLQNININLHRGSREEIAAVCGVSKSLVKKVLTGKRNNQDVVRAAENIILTRGAEYISTPEYITLSYSIMSSRTKTPFTALKNEIFPFCFPGLNFSMN